VDGKLCMHTDLNHEGAYSYIEEYVRDHTSCYMPASFRTMEVDFLYGNP